MVRFLQDRLLNFQLLNLKNITLTEGNSPVYRDFTNLLIAVSHCLVQETVVNLQNMPIHLGQQNYKHNQIFQHVPLFQLYKRSKISNRGIILDMLLTKCFYNLIDFSTLAFTYKKILPQISCNSTNFLLGQK